MLEERRCRPYLCLVVSCSAEDLSLFGWDGGVAVDEAGEHASEGLDAQGQGGDIKQEKIPDIATQHTTLDGCSEGHNLIWVHSARGLLLEHALHDLPHLRPNRHRLAPSPLRDIRVGK